jgi:hypothetical protein
MSSQANTSLGSLLMNMSTPGSPTTNQQYSVRRNLILGSAVFAAALVSGIIMVFWRIRFLRRIWLSALGMY